MCSKDLLLLACLFLLGGLRLTSTTTTTTFVAAMSIANQDLDRYFRNVNATQILATEDRIMLDVFNYAFLNYSYMFNGELKKTNFNEEKARYGEGRIFNVEGRLVHISDASSLKDDTACSPNILGTRGEPTPACGVVWIALVRRGHCTFEEKVKNVHAKGAAGVIIYNDKVVNSLEKMQIKDKSRNITAVITYQDIGLEMAYIVDQGIDVQAIITQGRNGSRPINTLNRTSVLFVSISFIVLMVISLVWLLFYYIQRFRYLQTKDQQSRQLCSVTKKAIMKIPTKTGKSSDEKDMDSDCCAICIEAYKPSDCIRVLPCKHEFHKNCIDPWLIEHRTCPMCKLDVLKFYGFVVGDQIHSTPSPQHVPPNMAALDERDVEVIVVALAPPFSAAHQPASPPQSAPHAPPAVASTHTQTPETHAHAYQSEQPASQAQPQAQPQPQHCCSSASNSNNNNCGSNSSNSNCSNSSCCSGTGDNVCHGSNCGSGESNSRPGCQQQAGGGALATAGRSSGAPGRRNSAPLVLQVSTASRQFLGSEESVLEYEPVRRSAEGAAAVGVGVAATASTANAGVHRPGALSDLIHSRDFVIDFPRIFVLDAGGATGTRETLFPTRLPERSQSSLSLAHAKDWMSGMSNKLEEQHGLRRLRKASARDDMQENLLNVCAEAVKKRRSRSADGRYSSSSQARQQAMQLQCALECGYADEAVASPPASELPHTATLYNLTETSYAQSRQRQRQDLQRYSQTRRRSIHRNSVSDIPLRELPRRASIEHSPPREVAITIQLNGEGVHLEQ